MAEVSPPHELWKRADKEHPDDPAARTLRYLQLMIEAGHVVINPEAEQEHYTLDDPPSHINRAMHRCWAKE